MASFDTFWEAGHKITKHNVHGSRVMGYRTFRAFFGTSPQICVIVWNMLSQKPANSSPEHLLWALMVLKLYNLESVNASLVDVTEKTFRKWSLIFIRLLAGLQVVNMKNYVLLLWLYYLILCLFPFSISSTGINAMKMHTLAHLL